MNLLPVQLSELTIGQPLLWDLFNQDQKQLFTKGEVLSNSDEQLLKKSSLFRLPKEKTNAEKPIISETAAKKSHQFNFHDMNLNIGDKLRLKLPTNIIGKCCAINGGFCNAKLIGYIDKTTVLVSMPQLAKVTNLTLLSGDQVTVQLFSGQYAFSFTSFVDSLIKSPIHYIHLSFPNKINGQIIRKSRRIKTKIVATITDNPTPTFISNLSMTGAELCANTNLGNIGETIALTFTVEVHNIEKTLSLSATIKSIKQTTNKLDETINFGLEFQALASEQTDLLQGLIYQELVEHPENQA